MSTWTSKAGLLSVVVLAACVQGLPTAPIAFSSPRAAPVLDGAVQVGLPRGYCIDRRAGREEGDTAVVVMGRCRDDLDTAPALLTTAIGPAGSAQVLAGGGQSLADYFTSAQGRAALSRSGRASAVEIVQAKSVGTAFMMRIRDGAVGEYWRGVEPVAGRLVTITVEVAAGTEDSGEALLDAALLAMRRANPATP
jgi:hypothetical protein